MKAPDKIYLERDKETNKIHHLWGRDAVISSFYEHIEYIRKKALLEWAKEQLDILNKQTLLHPDDEVFWGQRNAFKQLIDKLNEM